MKRTTTKVLSLFLSFLLLFSIIPIQLTGGAADNLLAGDVNRDSKVDASDARLALRSSAKLETLTANQIKCADTDGDKKILANDARKILRTSAKLDKLNPVKPVQFYERPLSADALSKYQPKSKDYEVQFLVNYSTDVAEHVILDDYYEIEINANQQLTEWQKQHYVGVVFNEDGTPFFYFPDPNKLEEGIVSFKVLHFSDAGIAKFSDDKMIDAWCERAAAQDVTRRISEEELKPGLKEMLKDAGLGDNQYAGAIVRYILDHDTRGEILTAAADGDMKKLKSKVANLAGEYVFGKVFTGEDDAILGQSMGDHADMIRDGIKNRNYAEMTIEIVKNIESNMLPPVNYARKFADLTVKLADIWADNAMNEEYENFKKLGGNRITDGDWDTCYIHMYGATHWLSKKGLGSREIKDLFIKRFENEAKIQKQKEEMKKQVDLWEDLNLVSTQYWDMNHGFTDIPPVMERLNSLRRIKASLKEMLTVNGKVKIGKGYMTEEDFLNDAVFEWVTNGKANRDKFYEWLRKHGIYRDDTGEIRDFAWVLVETRVDYADTVYPTDPGDYTYYYNATPGKHTNSTSYGNGDDYQLISFNATCTSPPSTIRPGDTVRMTMKVVNQDKGKDLELSATASVRRDYPDLPRLSSHSGHYIFRSTDGKNQTQIQVKSPGLFEKNPPSSATLEVYHKFGGPEDENPKTTDDGGQRIGIYFTACGAQTVWVYEWKPVA